MADGEQTLACYVSENGTGKVVYRGGSVFFGRVVKTDKTGIRRPSLGFWQAYCTNFEAADAWVRNTVRYQLDQPG